MPCGAESVLGPLPCYLLQVVDTDILMEKALDSGASDVIEIDDNAGTQLIQAM